MDGAVDKTRNSIRNSCRKSCGLRGGPSCPLFSCPEGSCGIERKMAVDSGEHQFHQEVRLIKGSKLTRVNRMIRVPQVMVVDEDGEQLGEHDGQHKFTIGQRRGIGVAVGKPIYVIDKNADTNIVTVGSNDDLTAGRHGVPRVDQQVHEDLLKLGFVTSNGTGLWRDFTAELDGGGQQRLDEVADLVDPTFDIHGARRMSAAARERKQRACQLCTVLRRPL